MAEWNKSNHPALRKLWNRVSSRDAASYPLTPEEVWNALNAFTELYPDTENGPAHVVLSDGNTEIEDISRAFVALRECAEPHVSETAHFLACLLELSDAERVIDHEPSYVDPAD